MRKLFLAILVAFGSVLVGYRVVQAMVVKYNNSLVNESGLSVNKTYPLPLNSYGVDYLSFTSIASSITFTSKSFTDGQQSTGTITVTSNTALATATASDFLTVLTTQPVASGSSIIVNGIPLYVNVQWFDDVTASSNTAISIKRAINTYVPGVVASTGSGSTVYSTASVAGLFGNNMTMVSNTSSITVNTANFAGGLDGARITIGAKSYVAGTDYQVAATAALTAKNIATVVNASSNTYGVISTAPAGSAIVYTTSTVTGLSTNYVITSSTDAALTVGGSTKTVTGLNGASIGQMWGGSDPAYVLVGGSATVVNITAHGFNLGLPVLYSTGSATAITGLTRETTYYVIPVSANSISLAKTSTGAVAGVAIVLTSSQTKTTADTFTLAPLAISGTPSYKWQVSNDCQNYYDYAVSSVTLGSFNSTGTVVSWDFGAIDYACVQLNVVAPTQGAISLKVVGNGKNSNN